MPIVRSLGRILRAAAPQRLGLARCRHASGGGASDSRMSQPRYSGLATFFRAPHVDLHALGSAAALAALDVALVGVPYDGGVTNRPGARFGPREVRSLSAQCVRSVNAATGVAPFGCGLAVADVGDAHVSSPFELCGAHDEIEVCVPPTNDAFLVSAPGRSVSSPFPDAA